ncbi:uncharacterized protein [Anabrus simplex]|uniref:uncharacterized protein n=1 Tax=Anabrus simplex TaxID=316456 RepID=UPI0034DD7B4F
MEDVEIDIELLISLVEARPVLWDKSSDIYKDRDGTRKGWKEVCEGLKEDFGELSDNEKNIFGKEVMKKWGNIRDSFIKSCKKSKEHQRSGSGAFKIKKYVYNDQLQFLKKLTEGRHTEDSLADNTQMGVNDFTERSQELKVPNKEKGSRKRRKPDELEIKMLQALESSGQPNRHLSFFNGIIPSLQTFDDDEIIKFQIGVLQLIENIKRVKRQGFYQSPAVSGVQTPCQYNMCNPGQPLVVQGNSPCISAGSSGIQFPSLGQLHTTCGPYQSTTSALEMSHSDSVSPALSTSSYNTDIDFTSL